MKRIRNKKEKGQSLVEFALTLPVLALLLSGLLDFGRVFYTYIALEEAAAEAALYYAINSDCAVAADGTACADPNNAVYRGNNSGSGEFDNGLTEWNLENIGDPNWAEPDPDGCYVIGCTVIVEVRYPLRIWTPGARFFIGNQESLNLRVQASQIIVFRQN